MDLFELRRPDHIDDPGWKAIEVARERLRRAWEFQDGPDVVGKAKELVETVAKVTVVATEGAVADGIDFVPVVKAAQVGLKRQPGVGLSQDKDLQVMAQSVQTMARTLGSLRNSYGTGHGQARVPDVSEEMATLGVEGALVWCRWALRRLGHVLADYPNDLIAAVQVGTPRDELREKFEAAVLAHQPADVQHKIGVVFGQQSSGGFGNATDVGVEPAIDGGYDEFPMDYRRGLLEGMLLTVHGTIGLTPSYTPWFVSLLTSLPELDGRALLGQLRDKAAGASWIWTWRGSAAVEPAAVVAALRRECERLPESYADVFDDLCNELLRTV